MGGMGVTCCFVDEAHMERVVDGAACVRRVVGGALKKKKKTCSDNRNVRPSMFLTH